MKYRKKPVEVEVIQWTCDIECEEALKKFGCEFFCKPFSDSIFIKTLEGVMQANAWDYIIKGVKGEFYPCKPDIFEMTYEKVE